MPTTTTPRTIYFAYLCGDQLGEVQAFFELEGEKLTLVTGWSSNDANWRGEYMGGLLAHLGARVEKLPDRHRAEALRLAAGMFGVEVEPGDGEGADANLFLKEGSSDKVYRLSLFRGPDGWNVEAMYGRRGARLRPDVKCEGAPHAGARAAYDRVLREKLRKGYKAEA